MKKQGQSLNWIAPKDENFIILIKTKFRRMDTLDFLLAIFKWGGDVCVWRGGAIILWVAQDKKMTSRSSAFKPNSHFKNIEN